MEDRRKFNGGNKNAGRKPKAEELKLVERLSPYQDIALNALISKVKENDMQAIKLFMEYLHGKPKQIIESDTTLTLNDFDLREHLGFKNDSTK